MFMVESSSETERREALEYMKREDDTDDMFMVESSSETERREALEYMKREEEAR